MKKIYLVEDEGKVLSAFELELKLVSLYDLKTESFGRRVLPTLEEAQYRPDLIILDIYIDSDKTNGEELYLEIRSKPEEYFQRVPVLLISSKIPESDLNLEKPEEGVFYWIKDGRSLLSEKVSEIFAYYNTK